jgi:hypothetical protein
MSQIPLLSALKLAWGAVALAALLLGILARRGRVPPVAGVAAAFTALVATAGLVARLTGTPVVVATAAAVGVAGLVWCRRALPADRGRRAGVFVFAVLAAGGLAAWTNFGTFHGPGLVHRWDTAHYLLGVRYFDELGYDGLYDCLVAADRADGLPVGFDGARPLRDLSNDREGFLADSGARISACPGRFTPARFEEFRADARALRGHFEPGMWRNLTGDRGYNGSPAFTLIGGAMAAAVRAATAGGPGAGNRGMAREVIALVLFDIACAFGVVLLLWWGFGLEAAALAALVLGLGSPWGYLWTGGCFGRHLWLLFAAGGLALAGRGRSAEAGAAMATAFALKLFPALLLVGPVLVWLRSGLRGEARRELVRFAAAGVCTLAVLAIAAAATQGPGVFGDFAANIASLQTAPKGNDIGLPVLIGAWLLDSPAAASETWASAALLVGTLFVWTMAAGRLSAWQSAALAPFVLLLSTRVLGYYGVFLVLLAPACRGSALRSGALGSMVLACLVPGALGWASPPASRFQTVALILGGAAVAFSLWRRGDGSAAERQPD